MIITGFLLVNLDFKGFGRFGETKKNYIKIEAQEQYSLIDTICNYIFDFGPPGKYLQNSREYRLSIGRLRRPTDSGFWELKYTYFPGGPQ